MSERRCLVQIVPRLPPATCGLGDHALMLADQWWQKHALQSRFLVADPNWHPPVPAPAWVARRMDRSPPPWLEEMVALGPVAMVLHYSGYGYAKRGAPLWLLAAVRRFRGLCPETRWITMFHELHASGPVTSSAFWMQPLQRWVVRRLCQLSDVARTSNEIMQRILEPMVGPQTVLLPPLPVFSNLGESADRTPWSQREHRLVLFSSNLGGGDPGSRFWERLRLDLQVLGIQQVTLVGRPVQTPDWPDVTFSQPGFLDAAEAARLLRSSAYGYAMLSPLLLAKSGVFAAFAAHGVVPVLPEAETVLPDGLRSGTHFLCPQRMSGSAESLQMEKVSAAIWQWYQPHNLAHTAAAYAEDLNHVKFLP
jgi:hypothetical protein